MLISASDTPADEPLRATVCVSGSGPSGLTLTRRLVESKVDVLVLEAGPLNRKLRIEPLASSRPYHNDWKRDLTYRNLYGSRAGRLLTPLTSLARSALRRGERAPNRTKAALARLSAPVREGTWVTSGLARAGLRARYLVDSGHARVLGYDPKRNLADGRLNKQHASASDAPTCEAPDPARGDEPRPRRHRDLAPAPSAPH